MTIVGRWLPVPPLGGGVVADLTTALLSEVAFVDPARFVAVTTTRSVWSTSMPRTPYVLPVAPATSVQFAPAVSQRCHWYANVRTPPVHVPLAAVSSSPGCSMPEIDGLS